VTLDRNRRLRRTDQDGSKSLALVVREAEFHSEIDPALFDKPLG
jgi:hypothetical protein